MFHYYLYYPRFLRNLLRLKFPQCLYFLQFHYFHFDRMFPMTLKYLIHHLFPMNQESQENLRQYHR
jgi:hypothetical protein